jgi:hypothetical protein
MDIEDAGELSTIPWAPASLRQSVPAPSTTLDREEAERALGHVQFLGEHNEKAPKQSTELIVEASYRHKLQALPIVGEPKMPLAERCRNRSIFVPIHITEHKPLLTWNGKTFVGQFNSFHLQCTD